MDKEQFFAALSRALEGLPPEDAARSLEYYQEMIDDRMEEGMTEYEAVAELGTVEEIAAQILADTPLTSLVRARAKPSRALRVWEIVLLVLGSPVWVSLLIAAGAVLLSLYGVLWALIGSLWAVEVAFAVSAVGSVALGILQLCIGSRPAGIALIGAGLILAGLAVFLFFGCWAATKGTVILTKRIVFWIKSKLIRKERAE